MTKQNNLMPAHIILRDAHIHPIYWADRSAAESPREGYVYQYSGSLNSAFSLLRSSEIKDINAQAASGKILSSDDLLHFSDSWISPLQHLLEIGAVQNGDPERMIGIARQHLMEFAHSRIAWHILEDQVFGRRRSPESLIKIIQAQGFPTDEDDPIAEMIAHLNRMWLAAKLTKGLKKRRGSANVKTLQKI